MERISLDGISPPLMTNFSSLLLQGIKTEMAVIDCINNHSHSLLSHFAFGHLHAYLPKHPDTPFDILVEFGNDIRSIEVKSADCGDKYPTFFAEIIQTASMGYAEYLVYSPNYIVYVDLPTNTHYWYNGDMFTSAVKARYTMRKPTRVNSEGVRFLKESEVFGFIGKIKPIPTLEDIVDKYSDEIEYRLHDRMQYHTAKVYKEAPFLPTLS
jgi:hypothetical protein